MQVPEPDVTVIFKIYLDNIIVIISIHISKTQTCHLNILKVGTIGFVFLPQSNDIAMSRNS